MIFIKTLFYFRSMSQKSFTIEEIKRKMERYCVYQDRCHQEVEQKLREFRLIPIAKEEVLLHLMKHDFLNEERFAKSFARGKFKIKHYGKVRIRLELKKRNISEYNIKTALKEIDDELYLETLDSIARKREAQIKESNAFKRKKKLSDYLLRKGYETYLVYEKVNELITTLS